MYLYTYTKYSPFLFPYHQSYSLDRIFADRACYPDDFCVARSTPQACGTSYVLHGCNIPKACHLYIPSLFETNISEIHVCRHWIHGNPILKYPEIINAQITGVNSIPTKPWFLGVYCHFFGGLSHRQSLMTVLISLYIVEVIISLLEKVMHLHPMAKKHGIAMGF